MTIMKKRDFPATIFVAHEIHGRREFMLMADEKCSDLTTAKPTKIGTYILKQIDVVTHLQAIDIDLERGTLNHDDVEWE